jgi:hypothetical protein
MEGFNDFPIQTKDYELAAEYSNTDFLICAAAFQGAE